jgi:fatty acid synthase, animal type
MSDLRYKRRALCEDPDEEIVITGISGRFPNSANVAEFADHLYNAVDMVDDAETRWRHIDDEIPRRIGKTVNLEKFDASFFSVHNRQANVMDAQCRILMEHAYEAIMDAGVSPKSLKHSKTGVIIGCCFAESEQYLFYEKTIKDGLGLTGSSRCMLANRISFSLDLRGPSYVVDTACSSGCYALDAAFDAMRNGTCDAVLVGGSNLMLHPYLSLQFVRLGVLSKDGFCRPLDKDAAGYTRSEAVNFMFLQKKKDAKRAYANVVYVKTNNDGFKKEGLTYPSGASQIRLLSGFYEDLRLNPGLVDYVEGHSTGTKVGDPEECQTLDTVYCAKRDKPLLLGAGKFVA